ncbi:hypothetical protein JF544_03125 [Halobacillus kuroshimensis]|uniref:Uncharacterized protein n=1 Tax=Halobacillus kuroshimensis TaxID=302481 RepID=A0ABS3DSF2_9BACI|nr:hypothetical protein [Halobacillus kuroshimensis]MBN8234219.1 hypothetical protein [Halobacillus kuroshimensis]
MSGLCLHKILKNLLVLWISSIIIGLACGAVASAGIPGPLLLASYGMIFLAGAGVSGGIRSAVDWTKRESG